MLPEMRKIHLMRIAYWLIWLVWAIIWYSNDAIGSRDSRVNLFLVGIVCLGIGFCILLPRTQWKRMAAYRNSSNYDSMLMFITEMGVFFLCSSFFLLSSELFEMMMQTIIKDVEVNELPLYWEPTAYSITVAYMGEVAGFYGINQGKVKFSFIRILVSVVFFILSLVSLP